MLCILSAWQFMFYGLVIDVPLLLQMLCLAIATVLLLGVGAHDSFRPLRFLLETVGTAAAFFVLNVAVAAAARALQVFLGSSLHYFVGIALFAVFFGRHKPVVRVVMASVVFSIGVTMAALGTMFGNALEMVSADFDIAWTKIAASLLTVVCAVAYSRYPLYRFRVNRFDAALNIASNLLSALLFVILEFWRGWSGGGPGSIDFFRPLSGYFSLVIVFVFAINVMTYFMTYFLCRERELTINYQMEQQRNASLKALLSLSEEKLNQLREVRHDVKNQYFYMQAMLEEGRYEELKAYFNELVGTFAKPLYDSVESGNRVVDSVLNMELSKARENGLKLNVRAAIPAELPFPQSAILGLFGNVLDNAVEACVREGFAGGQIDVVIGMQGDYMLFSVSNPTRKTAVSKDGEMRTDKADKSAHGCGMRIIRKIVRKYNGFYRNYIENGQFVSESMLDTKSGCACETMTNNV